MGTRPHTFREQLESLYAISIEIARLHELPQVFDRALGHCLQLTGSQFGFVGLLNPAKTEMDVAAIKGFEPLSPRFHQRFRLIPVRPSVFGVVVLEGRPNLSNDVANDARHVGQPPGHPPVRTFLGVPLKVGDDIIGMIGVANKGCGYGADDERLLATFANQAAVAIDNARLYESQREMIERLERLHQRLDQVEQEQVLHEERERIAADLHDRIEQAIFTIGLKLSQLIDADELTPAARTRVREVRMLAAKTAEAVKEVVWALSLPAPEDQELTASLRRLVRDAGRSSRLETDLVVSGSAARIAAPVRTVLHRIAQEALVNVVRHAQARMALVSLRQSSEHIDLVIQDDGVGAPDLILRHYPDSATHFGLKAMRRMAEEVGGRFTVANGEESGLAIRVTVPLEARVPAEVS